MSGTSAVSSVAFLSVPTTLAFALGGGGNCNNPPTSGTLTGEYWQAGNYSTTGTITANQVRLHVVGDILINNAITVSTEMPGGVSLQLVSTSKPVETSSPTQTQSNANLMRGDLPPTGMQAGGCIELRAGGQIFIASGVTLSAQGGAGGNSTNATKGGGGGGGFIRLKGNRINNQGTLAENGGSAGTGSATEAGTAGSPGVTDKTAVVWGPRSAN